MYQQPLLRRTLARAERALVIGALAALAGGAQERELPLASDLDAAIASVHGAFEAEVLRAAPGEARPLKVRVSPHGARRDPLRSALAAERFLARVLARGGRAHAVPSDELAAEREVGIELAVEVGAGAFVLRCGFKSSPRGPEVSWRVPFVEKPWVEGALPPAAGDALVLRSEARGGNLEEARGAARQAAVAAVREQVPAAEDLGSAELSSRLKSWELDRFERYDPEAGAARCALLLGLGEEEIDALRAAALRARRAAITGTTLRGGAGCLWLALCVMLCARADLATRGYLSWPLRAAFTLLFAAGAAALLAWS